MNTRSDTLKIRISTISTLPIMTESVTSCIIPVDSGFQSMHHHTKIQFGKNSPVQLYIHYLQHETGSNTEIRTMSGRVRVLGRGKVVSAQAHEFPRSHAPPTYQGLTSSEY